MKRPIFRQIGIAALLAAMVLTPVYTPPAAVHAEEAGQQEEAGFPVTFVKDQNVTVDVFYTQTYTNADESGVASALSRSSGSGNPDKSGNGQVNFRVNVPDGYEIESVTADQNYKNLKGSSDTGVEGIYRLTKITGPVTVTITTKKKETAQTEPAAQYGTSSDIVINEVNSKTPDWIEIYNKGTLPVDISGWYVTDDNGQKRLKKKKTTPLAEGTILGAGECYVFEENKEFTFGLGGSDAAQLYDKDGKLIDQFSWTVKAGGTYARVPDGTGEFQDVPTATKGSTNGNGQAVIPVFENAIDWPGSSEVTTYDEGKTMFKSDSSGLDFYKGQLYAINNKKGTFWVLNVNKDGTMDYADGFTAAGKNLAFIKDKENPQASDPDAEGITVDGNGTAYAAVERDNNNNKVNYDVILQFNPWENSSTVVASKEWDITKKLPDVPANLGIEAVEWVSDSEVQGKLYDQNTGAAFDSANYPDAAAGGVFFVALEQNGHVYAFILNEDGTSELISEIDPGIGGAMALDYDNYEKVLWVGADDGYGNVSAKVILNGTKDPSVTLVNPPSGMDKTRNNEGFAIAEPEYTVNGLRPVYHFMDGADTGVLTISYLHCDYKEPAKYTVTYTDGVSNEEIFADQKTEVVEGSNTPAFEGTPKRTGYTFKGWSPEVSEKVTADVTYTAIWEKETSVPGTVTPSPTQPGTPQTPSANPSAKTGLPRTPSANPTVTPQPEPTVPAENKSKFVDVPGKSGDLSEAVSYGVEKGFIKGVDDSHFNPNDAVTRAQFVAFLYRLAGSPKVTGASGFKDINGNIGGKDFADAISWAVENGIAKGYGDGTFRPFRMVTREEAVAFLRRFKNGKAGRKAGYEDVDQKAWYAEDVNWADEKGITVGKSSTIFGTGDVTTRGQAVQFIYRAEKGSY